MAREVASTFGLRIDTLLNKYPRPSAQLGADRRVHQWVEPRVAATAEAAIPGFEMHRRTDITHIHRFNGAGKKSLGSLRRPLLCGPSVTGLNLDKVRLLLILQWAAAPRGCAGRAQQTDVSTPDLMRCFRASSAPCLLGVDDPTSCWVHLSSPGLSHAPRLQRMAEIASAQSGIHDIRAGITCPSRGRLPALLSVSPTRPQPHSLNTVGGPPLSTATSHRSGW